ncbi:MAG: FAD-binding protein, partial [Patescibacteria group bacterium]
MAIEIKQYREYVDIKDHCTLKIGGQFRYFTVIGSIAEVQEAIAKAREYNKPLFVLGGGSNLVFSDIVHDVLAVKMEIKGFEIIDDTEDHTDIKVSAGEEWDPFVGKTVSMNLSGIEALSAIPGTVGATPVQNVGAYGTEVKDTIVSVEVFDREENRIINLGNEECYFSYRDSIFKQNGKGRYIILSVVFRLSKNPPRVPDYPGVKKYFEKKGIVSPQLRDIREAIT